VDLELEGRLAIVTGASRGIGLAVTRALADEGAVVVTGSRSVPAALQALADTGRVHPVEVDLATEGGPAELVARAAELGDVDVLVNNAGKSPLYPSLAEVTEELFDKVIALNLRGPFRLASLIGTRTASTSSTALPTPSIMRSSRAEKRCWWYGAPRPGASSDA